MIGDDADCQEKHDKGGDGVDDEDEREAGEQHGVEAGVDHGDGEAQGAVQCPGTGWGIPKLEV